MVLLVALMGISGACEIFLFVSFHGILTDPYVSVTVSLSTCYQDEDSEVLVLVSGGVWCCLTMGENLD